MTRYAATEEKIGFIFYHSLFQLFLLQEWDADYLEYGGNRNAHHQGGQQGFNQPGRPLRRPMTNNGPQAGPNGGYLPVPGGYNPYKINEPQNNKKNNSNNNKKPDGDVQKLKATLQTLEASLAKKNKEIADLKKAKDEENNMQALAETVARVQALRLNQNKKDDQNIREKVSDSARLVRDVHNSLTLLGKKSSDADKAVLMLNQCQEQMATLEDSQPLEVRFSAFKKVGLEKMRRIFDDFPPILGYVRRRQASRG
jgi:hypothetical protein